MVRTRSVTHSKAHFLEGSQLSLCRNSMLDYFDGNRLPASGPSSPERVRGIVTQPPLTTAYAHEVLKA